MKKRVLFSEINLLFIFQLLVSFGCNSSEYYKKNTLEIPARNDADDETFIDVPDQDEDSTGKEGEDGSSNDWGEVNQDLPTPNFSIDEDSSLTYGESEKYIREVFYQKSSLSKKMDIVWVIDNSGSMEDEQSLLAENFERFIATFLTNEIDFKMCILTTDVFRNQYSSLIDSSINLLSSIQANEDVEKFKNNFQNLIRVGTRGSSREQGLAALDDFFQRKSNSFLRNEAQLAIIVVSDEEDQSQSTLEEYKTKISQQKNNSELIKFFSIVDKEHLNQGRGVVSGYERYEFFTKFFGGNVLSINSNFSDNLTFLGERIVLSVNAFPLEEIPKENSIKVYVNDLQNLNFNYHADENVIEFRDGYVPVEGSQIVVLYEGK
jgi:hypothetical protein